MVVSNIFYFHPYLGKWSNLTNIFQMGWNHQLENMIDPPKVFWRHIFIFQTGDRYASRPPWSRTQINGHPDTFKVLPCGQKQATWLIAVINPAVINLAVLWYCFFHSWFSHIILIHTFLKGTKRLPPKKIGAICVASSKHQHTEISWNDGQQLLQKLHGSAVAATLFTPFG